MITVVHPPKPRDDAVWHIRLGWMVPIAAIATENEACAKLAERETSRRIAALIRARREAKK